MKNLFLFLISLSVNIGCSAMSWHEAAQTGNLDELQQLIQEEPQNINQTDNYGNTPLHYAADNVDALRILLDRVALAVINQTDNYGNTPLHLAARSGNVDALRILLDRGALAVINQTNDCGNTPLHCAASSGSEPALRILLDRGALAVINQTNDCGHTPLHSAARAPHGNPQKALDTIKTLVEFYQNLPLDNN